VIGRVRVAENLENKKERRDGVKRVYGNKRGKSP